MHHILSWYGLAAVIGYVAIDRAFVRSLKAWVAKLVCETPNGGNPTGRAPTWKELVVRRKLEIGDSFENRMWLDHGFHFLLGLAGTVLFAIYAPGGIPLTLCLMLLAVWSLLARIKYGTASMRNMRRLWRRDAPDSPHMPMKMGPFGRWLYRDTIDRERE